MYIYQTFIFTAKKEVQQMEQNFKKNKPEYLCSEAKALVTFLPLFNSQSIYIDFKPFIA